MQAATIAGQVEHTARQLAAVCAAPACSLKTFTRVTGSMQESSYVGLIALLVKPAAPIRAHNEDECRCAPKPQGRPRAMQTATKGCKAATPAAAGPAVPRP